MPNNISDVCDVEREIEKRFVTALRNIFEFDDKFIYNKDDKTTRVIITSEYPENDAAFKTPHITVTGIGFQLNLENTFYKNYMRDVIDDAGRCIGTTYLNVIPYSLSIVCTGELFLSKDLANKVVNYIAIAAKEIFDGLHLNISMVNKAPTAPQRQYPDKVFETVVSVQGHVEWMGTSKVTDITQLNILRRIKDTIESK